MAIQTINIGNIANDGTGDDLREAFIKVNNNFTELNTNIVNTTTEGANLGTGTGIFAQRSDNTLQFKSISAGSGISISSGGNAITITGTQAGLDQLIVVSDSGSKILPPGNQTLRIQGGNAVETRVTSDDDDTNPDGDEG